jgi:hypothetical protein
MRLAAPTLVGALILAATAVSANAAPTAPNLAGAQQPHVIPVAQGCGPAWHRTYWGECVPNRAVRIYRQPRDYVVEETWEEYY